MRGWVCWAGGDFLFLPAQVGSKEVKSPVKLWVLLSLHVLGCRRAVLVAAPPQCHGTTVAPSHCQLRAQLPPMAALGGTPMGGVLRFSSSWSSAVEIAGIASPCHQAHMSTHATS